MDSPLRWTSNLLRAFFDAGVHHVVISPGSRSTPLTMAAALHPGLNKTVVLDERSAAYIALGIGKQSGKPALLICTSGTALANYMPAVTEARESGVPMMILSADRPPNLRGTGSSQTIDQIKFFSGQTVFFHEAGEPRFETDDIKRLNYLGQQAVEASIRSGGAAHINLPFRKPLEPTQKQIHEQLQLNKEQAESRIRRISVSRSTITPSDEIFSLLNSSKKPLIVAGPANPHQSLNAELTRVADLMNAPVLFEPGSGVRHPNAIPGHEQFLRNPGILTKYEPDLIIRFGDQPFTKSILSALKKWGSHPTIHISARSAWQDEIMNVSHRIICGSRDALNLDSVNPISSKNWLEHWKVLSEHADANLKKKLGDENTLTDGHVFDFFSRQFDSSWNVMLSNSFIPRDMALFGQSAGQQFVNRGAAGIDGITSTALGISLSSNTPTCCMIGDLAFLHDSNALLSVAKIKSPFVVIIINNGGGTIFRMLPVYEQTSILNPDNRSDSDDPAELYTTYFETPQHVHIESLAKAHQVDYQRIESLKKLHQVDLGSVKKPLIIECVTDANTSMGIRKTLWDN